MNPIINTHRNIAVIQMSTGKKIGGIERTKYQSKKTEGAYIGQ